MFRALRGTHSIMLDLYKEWIFLYPTSSAWHELLLLYLTEFKCVPNSTVHESHRQCSLPAAFFPPCGKAYEDMLDIIPQVVTREAETGFMPSSFQ